MWILRQLITTSVVLKELNKELGKHSLDKYSNKDILC